MKVLTIYAHPSPKSFCHAVLEQFTRGLADAGHSSEIIDLYGIGFDPVWRDRDGPNWMDESVPQDILDRANLRQGLLDSAGGPLRRFLVRRWIGEKDPRAIIRARSVKPYTAAVLPVCKRTACSSAMRSPRVRSRAQCVSRYVGMPASQISPQCAPPSERPSTVRGWSIISRRASKLPST